MSWTYEIILSNEMDANESTRLYKELLDIKEIKLEKQENNKYISLKISAENFHKIRERVVACLAYHIVKAYKQQYFYKHMVNLSLPQSHVKALCKALTLFDMDSDVFHVLNLLPRTGSVVVSSFYLFRLAKLREKWSEFVSVTNINSPYLANKEIYIEFLKFLYSVVEPQCEHVNVFYNANSIVLKDDNNQELSERIDIDDEISLITNLIVLAPNTINLHCIDCFSNKTFKTLYYIFNKKINLMV